MWRKQTLDCMLLAQRRNKVTSDEEESLCMEMHNLLRVLWSGKWAVVTPYAFLRALWKYVPQFRNYQQQDAQEFLCLLFDNIEKELREGQQAVAPKNSSIQPITSLLFEGQMQNIVTCKACGHRSLSSSTFTFLPLDIPQKFRKEAGAYDRPSGVVTSSSRRQRRGTQCTIESCLELNSAAEDLRACYQCDACRKKNVDAQKRMLFDVLPHVLCLIIKRFSWLTQAKIDTPVECDPSLLDVTPFCSDALLSKHKNEIDRHYQLKSVVSHHGRSLRQGHYTNYSWSEEKGTWMHYNDGRVTAVDQNVVFYEGSPYLFFFEKKETLNIS